MVTHCIDGGLQCDARGYDQNQPGKGAVLDANYQPDPLTTMAVRPAPVTGPARSGSAKEVRRAA